MNERLIANKLAALTVALSDRLAEVSSSHHALLATLRHRGPLPVTDLAAIAGLSQPATTRALQELQRQALVEPIPTPGRQRPYRLTADGLCAARDTEEQRLGVTRALVNGLCDTERQTLDHLLTRLLTDLTPDTAGARHICRLCDHAVCAGPACPVGSQARALSKNAAQDNTE